MYIFSLKFCLNLILVSSLLLSGVIFDDVFAEEKEIISKSIMFENTSIIEFVNYSIDEIKTIIIHIGDSSFTSFKSQTDWTSPIASEKSITFTTSNPLKVNETVKFGMKTKQQNLIFQWEALDKDENLIESGITISEDIPSFVNPQEQKSPESPVILSNSTFKIIPNNPHPGSTIRVTGDDFAPNSSLTLFSIGERSKSFATDEDGHFMLTMKIPETQIPAQVNFTLTDNQENKKIVSLYISEIEREFLRSYNFTVSDVENEFDRSDYVEFSGTANPDSTIVIKIKDSKNNPFSTEITNTNFNGTWSTLISFVPTTSLGTYYAEITDGKTIITKSWDIVASKKLYLFPTKSIFKSGELITFNGTATPNEQINLTLVDPMGNQVLSNNFFVDPSGFFEIKYPTTSSNLKGTYVFYAFQNHESEFIFVGLDAYPKKITSTHLNNVNYESKDVAIIGITGENFQDTTISIMDENDHELFTDKIILGLDGKITHPLNLSAFTPGIYTALVSMASVQAFDTFTVDLQSSHEPIVLNMIKTAYYQGDSISITGNSQPHSIIDLFLIDPDGAVINKKETFTDKNGSLFPTSFLIPYGELFGKWSVVSESGLNSEHFEFQVNSLGNEGLGILVTDIISSSVGIFVTVEGFVSEEQLVLITISDPIGNIVFQRNIETTETGEFDLLWTAPPGVVGTYSVKVMDIYKKTASTVIDF